MGEERTVHECFRYNEDTRSYVEAVEKRHGEDLKEIKNDIKAIVYSLANRLPIWATLLISFLTLLVGGLLSKVVW